jgi:hypothetical protein
MQFYPATAALLGVTPGGGLEFARFLTEIGRAQGDDTHATADGGTLRQTTWRLMAGVEAPSPCVFEIWNALWEGALAIHDRHLRLDVTHHAGDTSIEWRVVSRP